MSNRKRKPKTWTKKEDEFVLRYYGKMTRRDIATALGRTHASINYRIEHLGLSSTDETRSKKKTDSQQHEYELQPIDLWLMGKPIGTGKASHTR